MRSPFNYRFGLPSPFYDNETGSFSPASLFALSEPGVWFDPSDVANLDWRRNLLQWTEQFDNAYWAKTAATIDVNVIAAPDGTMTADKLVETAVTSAHAIAPAAFVFAANTQYTYSVYVRAAERAWVLLQFPSGPFGTSTRTWLDLTAGVPGFTQNCTPVITPVGNDGWYRCSITATTTVGGSANPASTYATPANSISSYLGVLGSGLYIWGAQFELGTLTDYQPIDTTLDAAVISRFPYATLYQDSAGPIPVTTPGQTVALMLDKSKGLVLGPDVVTNGDFATDTDWSLGTGWAIGGGVASATAAASGQQINQVQTEYVTGRWYAVTFTVVSISAGGFAGRLEGQLGATRATPGTFTDYFLYTGGTQNAGVRAIGTTTGSIDNVSVKEIAGNHATQATTTARPTYGIEPAGGRRNQLLWTEQFDNAEWLKLNAGTGIAPVVTSNAGTAPNGTVTADRIVFNCGAGATSADISRIFQDAPDPASGFATGSIYLRSFDGVSSYNMQFSNGAISTIITVTGTWQRFSLTSTTTATNLQIRTQGDVTQQTADVLVWGAQCEFGSTATDYQRVTTQFDVTEAGKAAISYLWFDGLTDNMATSTITPGIDKAQVFTGVRKLRAADECIVEFSPDFSSNAGSFVSFAITSGYTAASRGSAVLSPSQLVTVSASAPVTSVISTTHDIPGDLTAFRLNGGAATNATGDQGAGNFLAYPLYLGSRGGTLDPFQGHIYSQITRFGATLTAATITSTDAWVAGKTGFYTPIIEGVPTIGVS